MVLAGCFFRAATLCRCLASPHIIVSNILFDIVIYAEKPERDSRELSQSYVTP